MFLFGMSLCIAFFFKWALFRPFYLPLLISIPLFAYQASDIRTDTELLRMTYPYEQRLFYQFLDRLPTMEHSLVIYHAPQLLLARNVSSYSYEQALAVWPDLTKSFASGAFTKLYVITGMKCLKENVGLTPLGAKPTSTVFTDCEKIKALIKDQSIQLEKLPIVADTYLEIFEVRKPI